MGKKISELWVEVAWEARARQGGICRVIPCREFKLGLQARLPSHQLQGGVLSWRYGGAEGEWRSGMTTGQIE
jgi:hypothetical protein